MTRFRGFRNDNPLACVFKQGCLWELMSTKIKNKFVSNLKKFIQIFFKLINFRLKKIEKVFG